MSAEPFTPEQERQRKANARRTLTWLIVFAIVMFFAGLTSAYVVMWHKGEYWVDFALPRAFHYSTAAILLSSATAHLALMSVRRGASRRVTAALLVATLALGAVFTRLQFKGWGELAHAGQVISKATILQPKGIYGTDYVVLRRGVALHRDADGQYFMPDDAARARPLNADMEERTNQASQFFYVLTFAHLAHLFFGLASMAVMAVATLRCRYTAGEHTGLWAGVVYWHFLAGLWAYLLSFLAIVH